MKRILMTGLGFLLIFLLAGASGEKQQVQIGYCGPARQIEAAKGAGFDYMELRMVEIMAMPDAEFAQLTEKLRQIHLPVYAMYQFLPGDLKLTGPNIDKQKQMEYVRKAFERMTVLGARIVVLGSGDARSFPAGFSKEAALAQLVEFCKRIGPEARARNITVVIEPQRRQESNLINTGAEGLALVEAVNDANIQLHLDFYHMEMEKDDADIVLKAKEHLRHVHMANPNARVFPLQFDEYNYGPFFTNLKKIGYRGGISIEASTKDFASEAPRAVAFLRGALAQ